MRQGHGRGFLAAALLALLLVGQLALYQRGAEVATETSLASVAGGSDLAAAGATAEPLPFVGPPAGPAEAADSWRRAGPRRLPAGSPSSVGMDAPTLARIDSAIKGFIEDGLFPGAVVLVARRGVIVKETAYGKAVVYLAEGERLAEPIPMRTDSLFDVASLTKLFTATAALTLVDQGRLSLDEPVAKYLSEFGVNGKQDVTVRHLLSHTAGLPPGLKLWTRGDSPEERLRSAYALVVTSPPGEKSVYSDGGPIIVGKMIEQITGLPLDEYLELAVLTPLGLADTMYTPPPPYAARAAATEVLPEGKRGVYWGTAHDGEARALAGVAGNAGLFSTASDVAILGQLMLEHGAVAGQRVLSPGLAAEALQPQPGTGGSRGLGWELRQRWYMGSFATVGAFGHTGFTGTALIASPRDQTVVVLLTNSLHPHAKGSTNPARLAVANLVYDSLRD